MPAVWQALSVIARWRIDGDLISIAASGDGWTVVIVGHFSTVTFRAG